MGANPWNDPDPKPADLDADLTKLDPGYVEDREGDPDAKLIVLIGVEGEDAKRLERISGARDKRRRTSSPSCFAMPTARPRSPLSRTSARARASGRS
jgi:hypothetical protein